MLDANGRANPYGDPNYLGSDAGQDAYPPITYTDTLGPSPPGVAGPFNYVNAPVYDTNLAAGLVVFVASAMLGGLPSQLPQQQMRATNAAAPQVVDYALAQGTGFYQRTAIATGSLFNIQTFGAHAVALYNAEAEKSSVWVAAAAPPAVVATAIGAYAVVGEQPQWQPGTRVWAALATPPTGVLGVYAGTADQTQQPTTVTVWPSVVAGPGFLGAYVAAAPVDPTQLPPVYRPALFKGETVVLGAYVQAAPVDPTQVAPAVRAAIPAHTGILGAYVKSAPTDPSQPAPVTTAPTVSYQIGFLGAFIGVGTPQSQDQPAPRVQAATPGVVAPTGILGQFYALGEQAQGPRQGWVWAAQPVLPVGYLGRFAATLEQVQDRPTVGRWAAAVTPGAGDDLGRFVYVAEQPQDRPTVALRAPAVAGPGRLGRYYAVVEQQPQDRVTVRAWPAQVSAPFGKLGVFSATAAQDPTQLAARAWIAQRTPPVLTSAPLGQFYTTLEQSQDRPTAQTWSYPAFINGPLTPAGVVAEVVAWAESQWGGLQGGRSSYLAGSSCYVYAEYFDYNRLPSTPAAVMYRVDDKASGINLLPWTQIVPAEQNEVVVSSAQNLMVNMTRQHETHQVLFRVTDGYGVVSEARVLFEVVREPYS